MRRKALMWLLGLGALAGFGSGIFGCHFRHDRRQAHEAFEEHVAELCTRAAQRTREHGSHSENQP